MTAEISTALSGEEAVRLAATRHFHIITMDQTLSASYCNSVVDAQVRGLLEGGGPRSPPVYPLHVCVCTMEARC